MKLSDIALFVKSANAGASQLTFDIGFADVETYRHVLASRAIRSELIARLYRVDVADVEIHPYDPAMVIKITIPRREIAGGVNERDFDGVQQFPLLLDLEIPPASGAPAVRR
jgi:hypothetical protein